MASCPSGYNLNPENKIKTKKKKIENKKTKKEKGGKGAYLTYNFQKYYIKVCVVFFYCHWTGHGIFFSSSSQLYTFINKFKTLEN